MYDLISEGFINLLESELKNIEQADLFGTRQEKRFHIIKGKGKDKAPGDLVMQRILATVAEWEVATTPCW